jgi:hypothetical protein
MILLGFTLAALFGLSLDDVVVNGSKVSAIAAGSALAGAAAAAEWQTIFIGAAIGAIVGVVIDIPDGSIKTRIRMLIASLGTSAVTTIPITDRLGWDHSQPTLLFVAAVSAFAAWPVLAAARKIDWAAIASKLLPRSGPKP